VTERNGYRHHELDTRVGTLDVAVPKLRSGTYFPEWLLERACVFSLPGKSRQVMLLRSFAPGEQQHSKSVFHNGNRPLNRPDSVTNVWAVGMPGLSRLCGLSRR
jgi:hypothetical protein